MAAFELQQRAAPTNISFRRNHKAVIRFYVYVFPKKYLLDYFFSHKNSQIILFIFSLFFSSVNVSQFMLAKLAAKWAMPVGNFTAWNMESNQMDKCPLSRVNPGWFAGARTWPNRPCNMELFRASILTRFGLPFGCLLGLIWRLFGAQVGPRGVRDGLRSWAGKSSETSAGVVFERF